MAILVYIAICEIEVTIIVCCVTANVNAGDVAVGSHLLWR